MLGKLLKHEFRATARIMGPMYLVLLALSLGANLSIRLNHSGGRLLNILSGIVITAFGFSIAAVCIMAIVLMANRFRTNLMSEEGYIMFTLPVSAHGLVWSKIIVSTVWFIATSLAVALSGLIVSFRVSFVLKFFSWLQEMFREITAYYAINGIAFLLEGLVLLFLACAVLCLLFYAAMAVGYSFANHKALFSVLFFFAFQFASQIVGAFVAVALDGFDPFLNLAPVAAVHTFMGLSIAVTLAYGAIFYFITTYMLKKRLNLE